jgi:hypothetical protein
MLATKLTNHQSNPAFQNTCKFGRNHSYTGPIFRNGKQVSPDTGEYDPWMECSDCGRVEDESGVVVLDPPFERCNR